MSKAAVKFVDEFVHSDMFKLLVTHVLNHLYNKGVSILYAHFKDPTQDPAEIYSNNTGLSKEKANELLLQEGLTNEPTNWELAKDDFIKSQRDKAINSNILSQEQSAEQDDKTNPGIKAASNRIALIKKFASYHEHLALSKILKTFLENLNVGIIESLYKIADSMEENKSSGLDLANELEQGFADKVLSKQYGTVLLTTLTLIAEQFKTIVMPVSIEEYQAWYPKHMQFTPEQIKLLEKLESEFILDSSEMIGELLSEFVLQYSR